MDADELSSLEGLVKSDNFVVDALNGVGVVTISHDASSNTKGFGIYCEVSRPMI